MKITIREKTNQRASLKSSVSINFFKADIGPTKYISLCLNVRAHLHVQLHISMSVSVKYSKVFARMSVSQTNQNEEPTEP